MRIKPKHIFILGIVIIISGLLYYFFNRINLNNEIPGQESKEVQIHNFILARETEYILYGGSILIFTSILLKLLKKDKY